MATKCNRRLRKKLHLGEFAEFGFEVGFGMLDPANEMHLLATLSNEVLEPNGMSLLHMGEGRIFVSSLESSLSDDARKRVNDWVMQQSNLSSYEVGPLVDAWHPPQGVRCFSSGRRTAIFVIAPGGRIKACRTGMHHDRYSI
jgi:uncharacterized protein YggL (DUF469 family)